ncbi:MAG: hypothetical protein J6U54_25710 [Clostridiales bacterium]|nr:hypothetical protein [Clostridiales bacterium]
MGTGFHGGFGATKERAYKKSALVPDSSKLLKNIRKEDIIKALFGVTDMSTKIAQSIINNEIGINILGDELFDLIPDKRDPDELKGIPGIQKGRQVYIRRSALTGYSVFVHEGTHAYEFSRNIPQAHISSHQGEYRAYLNEHEYQIKKGEVVEFKDSDDILVHILLNY